MTGDALDREQTGLNYSGTDTNFRVRISLGPPRQHGVGNEPLQQLLDIRKENPMLWDAADERFYCRSHLFCSLSCLSSSIGRKKEGEESKALEIWCFSWRTNSVPRRERCWAEITQLETYSLHMCADQEKRSIPMESAREQATLRSREVNRLLLHY